MLTQEIIAHDYSEGSVTLIPPGRKAKTRIRVIERNIILPDSHPEFDITVTAKCSQDDSEGSITIFNPIYEVKETREIYPGENPGFTVRFKNGNFGLASWKHIPSGQIEKDY